MEFVWIFLIWAIVMIILVVRAIRKNKKKDMFISKDGMKSASVLEEISKKRRLNNEN